MEKIFSDIKKTFDGAVKKSGEIVEVTKLKLAIGDTKGKIDSRFKALGKLVYQASGPEYSEQEGAEAIIDEINELYVELKNQEERLAELKNEVICKECGSTCSDDSAFCKKCGTKL